MLIVYAHHIRWIWFLIRYTRTNSCCHENCFGWGIGRGRPSCTVNRYVRITRHAYKRYINNNLQIVRLVDGRLIASSGPWGGGGGANFLTNERTAVAASIPVPVWRIRRSPWASCSRSPADWNRSKRGFPGQTRRTTRTCYRNRWTTPDPGRTLSWRSSSRSTHRNWYWCLSFCSWNTGNSCYGFNTRNDHRSLSENHDAEPPVFKEGGGNTKGISVRFPVTNPSRA